MDKKPGSGESTKGLPTTRTQDEAKEIADKAGAGFGWIREDGAICFGNECVVIKPNEKGQLQLTVKPSQCGEHTGELLLDYLIKTAGKGVLIEIPSEVEETTNRPATMGDIEDLKKS